ncbi:uncharacterized protein A4U43_C05F11930 [Asparagus officinalis]|uniref:Uncharacterized protein n=1 Tax=Asparagus officinalis TaxID=4686 RepID=A0A5P1ER97_ASPOF|nr:uncharacterized protein A4U43_C05F11930 [Asparagus officinalis]
MSFLLYKDKGSAPDVDDDLEILEVNQSMTQSDEIVDIISVVNDPYVKKEHEAGEGDKITSDVGSVNLGGKSDKKN